MRINTQVICNMPTGTPVYGFRLTNSTGAVVELTNWGARWLSAIVPDKHGEMANVLVSPTDLLSDEFYMGAIVGRFANRIGGASASTGKPTNWKKTTGRTPTMAASPASTACCGTGKSWTTACASRGFPPMEKAVIRATHTSRWNAVGTMTTSCPFATMEQLTGRPT